MNKRIVTFGEIMLRLSKPGFRRLQQGRAFEGNFGGSEANVAVSLACLGEDVEYVSRVPCSAMGDAALMHLREYGVDVSRVVRGGERLGAYYFESPRPCATASWSTTARTPRSTPSSRG